MRAQLDVPRAAPGLFGDGCNSWRRWRIVPDTHALNPRPLLTGLLGFPWPARTIEARCTALDPVGVGRGERGRFHRAVPAAGCTCGIYASLDGFDTSGLPRSPPGQPVVEGFVQLTGRVLFEPGHVRAERAEIIGPLVLRAGRPHWWVPTGWRPADVEVARDRYRIRWASKAGERFLDRLASQLADRYRVDVVVGSA